jgi:hypothetical protein
MQADLRSLNIETEVGTILNAVMKRRVPLNVGNRLTASQERHDLMEYAKNCLPTLAFLLISKVFPLLKSHSHSLSYATACISLAQL